jgi:hypothetical protein
MLGITVALFCAVAFFVDLKPQVGTNFFFSSDDAQFRQQAKIDRIFQANSQIIVSVASADISSMSYLTRIEELTRELERIKTVTSVESLTNGPKSFEDAMKSPFWRRLLIAEHEKTSNIIVFAAGNDTESLIGTMEAIVAKYNRKNFRIEIAGAAYVAEMIRHVHDHLCAVVRGSHGHPVSLGKDHTGHARSLQQRRVADVAAAGDFWAEDRNPNRQHYDNRIRRNAVAPRLYDIQLADDRAG